MRGRKSANPGPAWSPAMGFQIPMRGRKTDCTIVAPSASRRFRFNWLQVLGTAERSQVDQRVRQQLHPVVALLEAFKSQQPALELVFPRKGVLDSQA